MLLVGDHAEARVVVLKGGMVRRSYNMGGENAARNIELVQAICAILDEVRPAERLYSEKIKFVADRPGHDQRYAIDATRISAELGWRPSVTIEKGLRQTVEWYLANEAWWRPLLERDGVGQRLGVT